ncbi:MAG TPA: M1 family metallopeptidase [Candidatus Angelobacter sp.]
MAPLKKSLFFLLLLVPVLAAGQRLPAGVVPHHYNLTFTPDLAKAAFTGEETIELELTKPGTAITLNAAELEFQEAEVTQGEKTQTAKASFAAEKEQATLTVAEPLQAGPAKVHIKFTGTLNDKLRGFYLAKSRTRNYATTQFEATDARRAFPSFDEPALKAIFDITLVIDRGDTAISNGRIISDEPGPGEGKHTLKFSTTAKMSTYLVAMAVGDFVCSEASTDNIPIRVCGTPDKKALGTAALGYAQEILKYYNQYYGIPYPFGKLDIVGVPDFEAGAMENTAAIFYRESDLFIDERNASAHSRQNVFEVLAHEMAHQWFGDLVTMKWWDNVWLNESFATWMEIKPSQALHPEWNAGLDAVHATNRALIQDALRNTHAIRATAETPNQINELFDAISYEKGAAVLRMVESYVTPDVFRRGVNAYLRKFQYSNATAEDFWKTVAAASMRPVDSIMPTFVDQPGEPLITVKTACLAAPPEPKIVRGNGKRRRTVPVKPAQPKTEITLTQTRFWDGAGAASKPPLWMAPVCVKAEGAKPFCQILSQKEQVMPVTGCGSWVFVNANAAGYYRTRYDAAILEKLAAVAATELTAAERISLVNDEAALAGSGDESVAAYLNLVSALNQDTSRALIEGYEPMLEKIHSYLLTESDTTAFHAWVRSNFGPMLEKIGWTPAAGESEDTRAVRGHLIKILAQLGGDPEVIRHSVQLARLYMSDHRALDPNLTREVLAAAALTNDVVLFEQYLEVMAAPGSTPEELADVSYALARFSDTRLMERWLGKLVAPESRNQDAAFRLSEVIGNAAVRKPAWEWTKQHWPDVEGRLTPFSGAAIVFATHSFCDASARADVQDFFSAHQISAAERTLRQSLEQIDSCIAFRGKQQSNLEAWLQQRSEGAANGSR